MRNPYVVGNWVSGESFYGCQGLIDEILHGTSDSIWVMGNRRIGKTSLLRQLQHLTDSSLDYISLLWDMQGTSTVEGLSEDLLDAIWEEEERFALLSIDLDSLQGKDGFHILRTLNRAVKRADMKLLLLCDEAEVLIDLGRDNPQALQKLRKTLQGGSHIRTVITSTKALSELNDVCRDWFTSPFLHGLIPPRYLAGIQDITEVENLIRQNKAREPVVVESATVAQILEVANGHPYLTQWLCQKLYQPDGWLRPISEADLVTNGLLSHFFQIDYRHLSSGEREVLLQITAGEGINESQLQAKIPILPDDLRSFLYGLMSLGYIQKQRERFYIANHFFDQWLLAEGERLECERGGKVSDRAMLDTLSIAQTPRLSHYDFDIAVSFAGEDREIVQPYCNLLSSSGLRVFYDRYEQVGLWGANLYDKLDEVYRTKAQFCVIFISTYYATKVWTNHERKSAQARALQENREYVLPVRLDDTEIPGIPATIGYIDLREISVERLAEMTIQKIEQLKHDGPSSNTA